VPPETSRIRSTPSTATSAGNARSESSPTASLATSRDAGSPPAAEALTARVAAIAARRMSSAAVDRRLVALRRVVGVEGAPGPVVEDRLGAGGRVGAPDRRPHERREDGARERDRQDRASSHALSTGFQRHFRRYPLRSSSTVATALKAYLITP
jgi:hypothetical protein